MKILLVNPPIPEILTNKEYYIPSSLLYLAAVLRKDEVEVLDLNTFRPYKSGNPTKLCEGILMEKIADFRPSLIGLGCLFSGQFPDVLNFSGKIKEVFKTTPIVIGGMHPTIYPAEILANCPSIDWVVIGEGEESVLQLVNTLSDESYDFDKVDGFAYRRNGKVIVNPKRRLISNLDDIPFPAYDLINLPDYYHDTSGWHNPKNLPINMSIPIISSRGCPMHCTFCCMFMVMGHRQRCRTPEKVVDEIEFLYQKYGHRHFSFMDDNLTLNRIHILEICNEIIKRRLNIQFETPNGISTGTLNEEVLDALVSAGLVRVSLAIESGSDFIRNEVMRKRLSRDKIFEIIRLTKKHRALYVRTFFIMGMPEDTRETLEETYEMLKEIDIDKPIVTNLMPFPGTKVFEQALRDNLFIGNLAMENLWRMDEFYYTGNKRFFIKPYALELSELQEFRERFDCLIEEITAKKLQERKSYQYAKI